MIWWINFHITSPTDRTFVTLKSCGNEWGISYGLILSGLCAAETHILAVQGSLWQCQSCYLLVQMVRVAACAAVAPRGTANIEEMTRVGRGSTGEGRGGEGACLKGRGWIQAAQSAPGP